MDSNISFSKYRVSDSLQNRHPFTQKSARQILEDDKYKIHTPYGYHGIERNIFSLRSEDFAVEEKRKALRQVLVAMSHPEERIRALKEYRVIESMYYLFRINVSAEFNEMCCKVVALLVDIDFGKEMAFEGGLLPLLLDILENKKTRPDKEASADQSDRKAAAMALLAMARSMQGVALLLRTDPDAEEQESNIGSSMAIDSLVSILDLDKSKANAGVLLVTLQTLERISLTSAGRAVVAKTNVLSLCETILNGMEPKKPHPLLGDDITTKIILAICAVMNNVALDGEGKRKAAEGACIIALAQAIAKAVDVDNLEVMQIAVRAITMILIIEDSKQQVLKTIQAPKKCRSTHFDVVQLLCYVLLDYAITTLKEDKTSTSIADYKVKMLKAIRENVTLALVSISELPAARYRLRVVLQEDDHDTVYDLIMKRKEANLIRYK